MNFRSLKTLQITKWFSQLLDLKHDNFKLTAKKNEWVPTTNFAFTLPVWCATQRAKIDEKVHKPLLGTLADAQMKKGDVLKKMNTYLGSG